MSAAALPGPTNSTRDVSALFTGYYRQLLALHQESECGGSEHEWSLFVRACTSPLPLTFRCNTPCPRVNSDIATRLEQLATCVHPSLAPERIPWMDGNCMAWRFRCSCGKVEQLAPEMHSLVQQGSLNGALYRQEEVSMVPVQLLQPQPHHSVLGMCASPGSKTSQIPNRRLARAVAAAVAVRVWSWPMIATRIAAACFLSTIIRLLPSLTEMRRTGRCSCSCNPGELSVSLVTAFCVIPPVLVSAPRGSSRARSSNNGVAGTALSFMRCSWRYCFAACGCCRVEDGWFTRHDLQTLLKMRRLRQKLCELRALRCPFRCYPRVTCCQRS
jgi:hypothetical protein